MRRWRAELFLLFAIMVALAVSVAHGAPAKSDHVQSCNDGKVFVNGDLKIVCSAAWKFTATCTGEDLWTTWTITGQTSPKDSFVRPWTDHPITVIGYELVKIEGDDSEPNSHASWFMVGSGIWPQPDAMVWLAPGERHSKTMWPSGMGQIWPGKSQASGGEFPDIIDLHGVCFGGGPISIFLTVYYSPNGHYYRPPDERYRPGVP